MTDLAWMKTLYRHRDGPDRPSHGRRIAGAYERLRRHYWQHGNLPEGDARLIRISSVEPDRWAAIAPAIFPLLATALPKLDQERSEASGKREKKVASWPERC